MIYQQLWDINIQYQDMDNPKIVTTLRYLFEILKSLNMWLKKKSYTLNTS